MRIEVVSDWNQTHAIMDEWNQLNMQSGVSHPFTTYEWFDCWYKAFCDSGRERVIFLREKRDNRLRAVLPGMLIQMKKGGIPLNCFSYAGNGHSPRCGIIVKKDDKEAIHLVFEAIWNSLGEKINLAILMSIDEDFFTHYVLNNMKLPYLTLHIEHYFESPAFDLQKGWESYLATRSKNFRHRIRQGKNRAMSLGGLSYDVNSGETISNETIDRLKNINFKTWQHKSGSGLFSTIRNEKFYSSLLRSPKIKNKMIVCFSKIGGRDVAFELGILFNETAFFLKYGYDPDFSNYSPGLLINAYLSEYVSTLGIKEIDLIGEVTEEKMRWQTHSRKHANYWLINNRLIGSKILLAELKAYKVLSEVARIVKTGKGQFKTRYNTGKTTIKENRE